MENENAMWWSSKTVAVVTGSNRGIGFEIVRQLAQNGLTVILTSRDESKGEAALKTLEGLPNLFFHHLDVQNPTSISLFALWLNINFGGLDILINNAALNGVDVNYNYLGNHNLNLDDIIMRKDFPKYVFRVEHDFAQNCIDVNYYGAKRTIEALLPLFKSSSHGARIINVSSSYGLLMQLRDEKLQQEMDKVDNLSLNYIEKDFIANFLEDVKRGEWSLDGKGWPSKHPVYKISKIALNAYTRRLADELQSLHSLDHEKELRILKNIDISVMRKKRIVFFVNNVHPGVVRTHLSFNTGDLSPSEGAYPIVKLALMPSHSCPTGKFFFRDHVSNF